MAEIVKATELTYMKLAQELMGESIAGVTSALPLTPKNQTGISKKPVRNATN